MLKIVVTLSIVFSLLLTPLVHAADLDCVEFGKAGVEKVVKNDLSKSEKQTVNGEEAAHHGCCSHTAGDRLSAESLGNPSAPTSIAFPTADDKLSSLTLGPPLQPPSHA